MGVKVELTAGVKLGDKWHKPGDVFEGDQETVDYLIASGAARDPKADASDVTVDNSVAEVEAKEIVDAAKAEATKILEDSKSEASEIGETAKAEAEEVVAQANAEADRIVKEAQEAVKAAPAPKTDTKSK
ncbi:hypothetical protein [Rhodococcus sp. NPDC004095]